MANFEVFRRVILSSINLLFLKSDICVQFTGSFFGSIFTTIGNLATPTPTPGPILGRRSSFISNPTPTPGPISRSFVSTPTPQPQNRIFVSTPQPQNRIFVSTPQPQNRIFAYTPQGKSLYFTSKHWVALVCSKIEK